MLGEIRAPDAEVVNWAAVVSTHMCDLVLTASHPDDTPGLRRPVLHCTALMLFPSCASIARSYRAGPNGMSTVYPAFARAESITASVRVPISLLFTPRFYLI